MIDMFRWLLRHSSRSRRRQFALLTLLIMAAGILDLVALSLLALFVTCLTSPETVDQLAQVALLQRILGPVIIGSRLNFILLLGSATVVQILVKNVVLTLQTYATARFSGALNVDFGHKMLRGFLNLPYDLSTGKNTSDVIQVNNWRIYISLFCTNVITTFSDAVISLLLFSSLFILHPVTTLCAMFLLGGVGGLTFFLLRNRIHSVAALSAQDILAVGKLLLKSVQGLKDLKLFNAQQDALDLYQENQNHYVRLQARQRLYERATVWILETVGFGGLVAGSLVMLASSDVSSVEMMGSLSMLAVAAWRILPAMHRMAGAVSTAKGYMPQLNRIRGFLTEVAPYEHEDEDTKRRALPPLANAIELRGLGFRYHGAETMALRDVDLTIAKGATIGFVGRSGAGKSTLADLLIGLLEPSAGSIEIDGRPLDRSTRWSWRGQVGFVPQTPYLFDGTAAENIAFTVTPAKIDREAVRRCCSLAGVDDFLAALPDGLDTPIGERGALLSGGQAQRISIARALYADPSVLVFDEATSSLDDRTEKIIQNTVNELRGKKTILIIAHRLSTVEHCDEIVRLENGRIVETGPPETVLPRYRSEEEHSDDQS